MSSPAIELTSIAQDQTSQNDVNSATPPDNPSTTVETIDPQLLAKLGTDEFADVDENGQPKKAKAEEQKTVGLFALFQFCTPLDYFLLLLGTIGAIINGVAMPLLSYYLGKLLDDMNGPNFRDKINLLCIVFTAIGAAAMVGGFLAVSTFMYVAERSARVVRMKFLKATLSQDIGYFDSANTGDVASRLTAYTRKVQEGIGDKFALVIQALSTLVSGLVIGFVLGWKLSLVILAPAPVMVIVTSIFAGIVADSSSGELGKYAAANHVCLQALDNIRTVVSYGMEGFLYNKFARYAKVAYHDGIKRGVNLHAGVGFFMFVIFAQYALGLWYGGYLIKHEEYTWGEGSAKYTGGVVLAAFYALITAFMSLGQSAPNMSAIASAQAALYSILEVVNRQSPIDPFIDGESNKKAFQLEKEAFVGGIYFADVTFSYPTRKETTVLNNFTYCFQPYSTIALCGPSGCGKTSTMQLIERFYDPDSGNIFVQVDQDIFMQSNRDFNYDEYCQKYPDLPRGKTSRDLHTQFAGGEQLEGDHTAEIGSLQHDLPQNTIWLNLKDINIGLWRRQCVGLVNQQPVLWSGTILDNLRYAKPTATMEEIEEIAKQCGAHDFVMEKHYQYKTDVGENGQNLSGGQRQRLSLARTLLAKPKLALFDEITSMLDSVSEKKIQATLDELLKTKTFGAISIAHRLSTIYNSDIIVVMKEGRIIETGNHQCLSNLQGGIYKSMIDVIRSGRDQQQHNNNNNNGDYKNQKVLTIQNKNNNDSDDDRTSQLPGLNFNNIPHAGMHHYTEYDQQHRGSFSLLDTFSAKESNLSARDSFSVITEGDYTGAIVPHEQNLNNNNNDDISDDEWMTADGRNTMSRMDNMINIQNDLDDNDLINPHYHNDFDPEPSVFHSQIAQPSRTKIADLPHNAPLIVDEQRLENAQNDENRVKNLPPGYFRRFMKDYTKREWPLLLTGTLLAALEGGVFPVYSILMARVLIYYYWPDKNAMYVQIVEYAMWFLALAAASMMVSFLKGFSLSIAGERVLLWFRKRVFYNLLHLEVGWHDDEENSPSIITTKLASDTGHVRTMGGELYGQVVVVIVTIIVSFIISFERSWMMTLVMFIVFPVLTATAVLQWKIISGFGSKSKQFIESAGLVVIEGLRNIRIVTSFNGEQQLYDKFSAKQDQIVSVGARSAFFAGLGFGVTQFCLYGCYALSFYIGSILVEKGHLSFEDELQVFLSIEMASFQAGSLLASTANVDKARAAFIDLYKLIDRKSLYDVRKKSTPEQDAKKITKCVVEFKNVHFHYPTAPTLPVLKGVSFKIDPTLYPLKDENGHIITNPDTGEPELQTVLMGSIGNSGGGKSTISAQLLPHFYRTIGPGCDEYNVPHYQEEIHLDKDGIYDEHKYKNEQDEYGEDEHLSIRYIKNKNDPTQPPSKVIMKPRNKKTAGQITIDGIDVDDFNLKYLRKHIVLCQQDPPLFYGTIRENIQAGDESITDEEITAACKIAYIDHIIEQFPKKYDTFLSNNNSLSGGQRARVCLARAFARKDVRVIVLDESLAALDNLAGKIIQENLVKHMKNKIIISIAHRLDSLRNAQKIVVLQDGKIVENGTHEELMKIDDGKYRNLLLLQQ